MFIRVKKRKNKAGEVKAYAYVVESTYKKRKKSPRQKAKKYLGRVYYFKHKKAVFEGFTPEWVIDNEYQTIIKTLIVRELKQLCFVEKDGVWENKLVVVDIAARRVWHKDGKNEVCIALNEGFLTKYTLRRVLDFKPPEALERQIGKALGDAIVSAGVQIDQRLFISLFRKIIDSLG